MSKSSRHDAWSAGSSYEAYMGRWSREVAPRFLDWIAPEDGWNWLEVGCGTGALSAAILGRCNPSGLTGVDPSEVFIELARQMVPDPRARFQVGDGQSLSVEDDSCDIVVSALVLNFLPDKIKALKEMKRVARPGGTIAFYVWDYPGGGMEFMRAFWAAAIALDAKAEELAENKRFPFCTPDGLTALVSSAGLDSCELVAIEVPTVFQDMADFWHPFTLGVGPAPGYCMSLEEGARKKLHDHLEASLPRSRDGLISLKARAWAVKAQGNSSRKL